MSRPNVLLVTIDCLRADRCGFAGHHRDTTPTLDSLSSESIVYKNAQAPGPRTSESVPGILSGRLSADCAYLDEPSFKAIPADAETLATWMQRQGYETIATVANPQLSPVRNFDRGFDRFENLRINQEGDRFESLARGDDSQTGPPLLYRIGRQLLSLGDVAPVNPTTLAYIVYRYSQLYRTWPTVDSKRVISELISQLSAERTPFFAWTHLNDLHAPLHPERVRDGEVCDDGNVRQFVSDAKRVRQVFTAKYEYMYDSVIRYVDAQLERLFSHLREIGEYNNTLIIVTADHGEALYDRGIYEHAAGNDQRIYDEDRDYLYRELLNVPLIVRAPSGEMGNTFSPFSLLWLHEVIADRLDIPESKFPESSADSFGDAAGTVLADTLTEQGHTIAAISETTKVLTDGTKPDDIDPNRWLRVKTMDEGERTWMEDGNIDPHLIDMVREKITSHTELETVQGSIAESTKEQLADLGYR